MLRVRVRVRDRVRVSVRVRKARRIMKRIIDVQTTVDWLVLNNTGIILSYIVPTGQHPDKEEVCTSKG
jgi:hypothetical protein